MTARQARAALEAALDEVATGGRWPWCRRCSLWIDQLIEREERAG